MSDALENHCAVTEVVTLEQFAGLVASDIDSGAGAIYRGQRDAKWKLIPSLFRTPLVGAPESVKGYFEVVLPIVHQRVSEWTNRTWDLANSLGMAEFVAFLQHNGFPTPLLDWTYSPYVATYFAFESVSPFTPSDEHVSIYRFDAPAWLRTFKNHSDYSDPTMHVSLLMPRGLGNQKLVLQQGCFTWSTIADVESHIRHNEIERTQSFLTKYEIRCDERARAMRHLKVMGISAVQLMPSVEAVCKKALEDILAFAPLGRPTDLEAAKEDLLESDGESES